MERGVLALNRRIPGPTIHVCRHDLIVVDVVNHMEGLESTIHWHGAHQYDTPWMDGVPMITQCPIPNGAAFRYAFNASEPGTQLYHSHSGHQKANGHYGLFVIRSPTDINRHLYDYDLTEHHIIISDWTLDLVEKFVPGLQSSTVRMDSILINGRGRHFDVSGLLFVCFFFVIATLSLATRSFKANEEMVRVVSIFSHLLQDLAHDEDLEDLL